MDLTDVDESTVLAVVRIVGKSSNFGEIDVEWAWLITSRDGKATQVRTFADKREARRVAELPG